MINIAVRAQRVFTLPADAVATMAYFRDFEHILTALPPLRLLKTYAAGQYRVLYSATEAGGYRVAFHCDIQARLDESEQVLRVTPLEGIPPVPSKATLRSLTGQATYCSLSAFQAAGPHTIVNYEVEIKAGVPKRLELALVPDPIIRRIVQDVVHLRLEEMADAFVARSIEGLLHSTGAR